MRIQTFVMGCLLLSMSALVSATTIEMDVNGLVCAFCAQGIQKKLRTFPATADVVVSLEKKLVAVSLKDGDDISDDQLRKSLTDAGYAVKGIRRVDESIDDVRLRLKAKTP